MLLLLAIASYLTQVGDVVATQNVHVGDVPDHPVEPDPRVDLGLEEAGAARGVCTEAG